MPYSSVIAAVMAKYGALNASNFPGDVLPPIFLDEAPQQTGASAQQRPPYTIIRDGGGEDQWDTEVNAVTPGTFTLEVYYSSADAVGDCDTAMNAILWNGANPNQIQGIGFMTLDLTPPLYGMGYAVVPTTDQHNYAGLDYAGQRTYKLAHDFRATYQTRGTG